MARVERVLAVGPHLVGARRIPGGDGLGAGRIRGAVPARATTRGRARPTCDPSVRSVHDQRGPSTPSQVAEPSGTMQHAEGRDSVRRTALEVRVADNPDDRRARRRCVKRRTSGSSRARFALAPSWPAPGAAAVGGSAGHPERERRRGPHEQLRAPAPDPQRVVAGARPARPGTRRAAAAALRARRAAPPAPRRSAGARARSPATARHRRPTTRTAMLVAPARVRGPATGRSGSGSPRPRRRPPSRGRSGTPRGRRRGCESRGRRAPRGCERPSARSRSRGDR